MSSLLKILSSTITLLPLYITVFISAVMVAGLGLITPFILGSATDTITGALSGRKEDVTGHLVMLSALLLIASLANTVLSNIGGWCGDVVGARLRKILSTRYYAKLLSLPQSYFDSQVTGTIIARLDRSITNVTQFLQSVSNSFLPMMLQVTAILIITVVYYWPLAILLALLFPIYMWLTTLTSKRWQKFESQKNEAIDIAGGRFSETISQIKVVKSYTAELRELDFFSREHSRAVDLTKPQSTWWHLMDAVRGTSMNIIFFAIYLLIFLRTLNGQMTLGDMVMLISLINMARQPVFMMSWIVDAAQRAIAGSRDYFKVLVEASEPTSPPQLTATVEGSSPASLDLSCEEPLSLLPGEPVFELRNVSFAYENNKPVLEDISFRAEEGQRIALVGESGGGKSTIVNLLLGLYHVSEGQLMLCGQDVSEVNAKKVRASVGVVFQESFLFSGTIRENIAYGKPDATEEEIIEVARRANAHDFIMDFPEGYDTIIGERGLRLSGGQKQRIAVARAMLKDAPVLVLDEATSALDTKSERLVQAGLDELMKNRTTLIIAHRLSTIADVDTIVTLDHGRVDEIGSPAQLATSGGIYAQLLELTRSASETDRERLKRYGLTTL